MPQNGYLSPAHPHILAHRGFSEAGALENTIEAFRAALELGATHLETDLQHTKDGVAVVFHDPSLKRLAGIDRKLSELTLQQLRKLGDEAAKIATLDEVLSAFPQAKFNLDLKSRGVIAPAVASIQRAGAAERVLVSSFSECRRLRAIQMLKRKGIRVATSPGLARILVLVIAAKLNWFWLFERFARDLDAVQIPDHKRLINLTSPRFMHFAQKCGLALHYWVINDAKRMLELVELGASGVVTDRADTAVAAFRR
ncbi:MAG: glycerophosphodiester phosphodiesterase family protein [Microbacteriaceae bacterium]